MKTLFQFVESDVCRLSFGTCICIGPMTVRAVVLVTTALAAPRGLRGFDLGNFFDEGSEDSFFNDGPEAS